MPRTKALSNNYWEGLEGQLENPTVLLMHLLMCDISVVVGTMVLKAKLVLYHIYNVIESEEKLGVCILLVHSVHMN